MENWARDVNKCVLILTDDENRVVLPSTLGQSDSDYINASFISVGKYVYVLYILLIDLGFNLKNQ